ncbi:MAG: hypothetical protein KDI07_16775 [Anaerolineae bacterium]|nr:hypothetical protein [Anaerolineae bacterium]MCB0250231.1 hypothetical protein [Anaerolineae bacterium]
MLRRRSLISPAAAILALLVATGLLLRLLALGSKPLWQDEGTSVYYAQLPLQIIFRSLCDPHPPGYYVALQAALAFGRSEWWVRLPSALGGALAVQANAAGLALTPQSAQWVVIGALVAALLASVVVAFVVRRSAVTRKWLGGPWGGVLLVTGLLLLALWGVAPRLYSVKRHLVVILPYVAIAVAWTLSSPAWRCPCQAQRIALALLVSCSFLSVAAVLLVPKSVWRDAVEILAVESQPGDSIWVDEMNAPVFNYYWQDRRPWQPLTPERRDALIASSPTERVWLIGDVTQYRNVHATLPPGFLSTRVASFQYLGKGLEIRAYDTGTSSQPIAQPSQALLWGLTLASPLEIDCH